MKRFNLLAMIAMASTVYAAKPADLTKGKAIAEQVCAACHAADGNSAITSYPKLASQHAAYIHAQTLAIKDSKRTSGGSAMMTPMVQALSEDDIRNVSAFYAKQTPKNGEANPKDNPELGEKIFRGGIPEKKVPACMACHSANGAGIIGAGTDISAYPRLGGQHSEYTVTQLKAYASGARTSPNGIMETISKRLTEEEMKAVATFSQGLH